MSAIAGSGIDAIGVTTGSAEIAGSAASGAIAETGGITGSGEAAGSGETEGLARIAENVASAGTGAWTTRRGR